MKPYKIVLRARPKWARRYDMYLRTSDSYLLGSLVKDKTGRWWYFYIFALLRAGPYETRREAAEALWVARMVGR